MHFTKSLQGSKSAITMLPVSIELTLLLFLLIWNFLGSSNQFASLSAVKNMDYALCVYGNHNHVTWLDIKDDQGLPCVHHHIPRSRGKPF